MDLFHQLRGKYFISGIRLVILDFSINFVFAALSPAATMQSEHMSYVAFTVCHKELK